MSACRHSARRQRRGRDRTTPAHAGGSGQTPSTPAGADTDPSARIRDVPGARCGISVSSVPAGAKGGIAGDRYGRCRGAHGLGRVTQEGGTQPSHLLRSQRRAEPCLGIAGTRGFCYRLHNRLANLLPHLQAGMPDHLLETSCVSFCPSDKRCNADSTSGQLLLARPGPGFLSMTVRDRFDGNQPDCCCPIVNERVWRDLL